MNRIIRFFIFIFLLGFSAFLGCLFFLRHNKVIDFTVLEHYKAGKPSILLDDEGNEWARFQLDRREPISLNQMPPHLINAFIAAEDWNFFNHAGLSWKGIIRSVVINIYKGRRAQGASTITQQLVRLLFFDAKKTFQRKLKEQLYALIVEYQFSKEQILETYLNHVFFGCGIYGVQAACQRFWGKNCADISLDQAALLAGIMRSPNRYCPIMHPLSAQKRRDVILHSMKKLQFITEQEYQDALKVEVVIQEKNKDSCAPHLKEMIRIFMEDLVGKKALYSEGFIIQTTLNSAIQKQAQHVFADQFKTLHEGILPGVDGALLTMQVKTGAVKALIGGVNFAASQWNRAWQAKRQMGSTIKPLIYAAYIKQGGTFADIEYDEPIELMQPSGVVWKPNNVSHYFHGWKTLAWALSTSNNIIAIKTFMQVGANAVVELAQKCQLKEALPYPSLALGCIDVTLAQVASMFNIFANNGLYVEPHYISWIKDSLGRKVWRHVQSPYQVMDSQTIGQVAKVLELGLERLRRKNREKQWLDCQAISKTGTTNDSRTCWFTGSTPELTTAIYVGHDDNRSMGENIFPLRTAFPIWFELNRALESSHKKFSYDPTLKEIVIDERTGRQTYHSNPYAITIFE